jgi:hypothetical protein
MFYGWWDYPYEGEIETLHLRADPFKRGLGLYLDVDDKTWDIVALRGDGERKVVNARLACADQGYDYSSETSNRPSCVTTYIPYYFEVEKKE